MTKISTLIVDQYGSYVGRRSERIRVTLKRKVLAEAPVMFLEQVLITSKAISISTDALALCAGQGIPTVLTRRAQYAAYDDSRGLDLAVTFVTGKIQNQARLLKYLAKSRREKSPECYAALRQAAKKTQSHLLELKPWRKTAEERGLEACRAQLLAVEGRAARYYWGGLRHVLPEELAWPGRKRRGARDPFNSALNYGYGVLYGQVERAILLAGLDPYAGYIHVDRPGKPSLVLDLIEEFRAPVVDRAILGLIGQGVPLRRNDEGWLARETRRAIAERVLHRLEESTERYERKRQKLRWILQSQARHLATYLRGERAAYRPFLSGW
jgi:CRISPR-associated protein Cas1